MKIVADEHIPFVRDYFSPLGDLVLKPGRQIQAKDVQDADLLLVRSVTHVNGGLLENSRVKFVGSVTAGKDHLDHDWLDAAGIAWQVASGFNAPPVADYVVSVIAQLQKKNILTQQARRAAVIGVGNVGKLVVERLQALSYEVCVCDPLRAEKEPDFTSIALSEIAEVDLILLHVPLTKQGQHPTFHFINKAFIKRQKKGCVLINASRGAVIDDAALLNDGNHMQWCLDVWQHEPNINKAVLAKAVLATPHIAGYSRQSKIRGIDMIYEGAIDAGVIDTKGTLPIEMPRQTLNFALKQASWRDIVLEVFNPGILTMMMKTKLLPETIGGQGFDDMRHQFNDRHEFAYTSIDARHVVAEDLPILAALNITLV